MPKGGAPSPAAATTVNGKPSGAAAGAAAASEQLVNSPTVPADGRPAPRHSFSAPFSSRLVPHWELGAGDSRCAAALRSLFQRVILTLLSMLFSCV